MALLSSIKEWLGFKRSEPTSNRPDFVRVLDPSNLNHLRDEMGITDNLGLVEARLGSLFAGEQLEYVIADKDGKAQPAIDLYELARIGERANEVFNQANPGDVDAVLVSEAGSTTVITYLYLRMGGDDDRTPTAYFVEEELGHTKVSFAHFSEINCNFGLGVDQISYTIPGSNKVPVAQGFVATNASIYGQHDDVTGNSHMLSDGNVKGIFIPKRKTQMVDSYVPPSPFILTNIPKQQEI